MNIRRYVLVLMLVASVGLAACGGTGGNAGPETATWDAGVWDSATWGP